MITKYQEFILEKKENELLELITEAVFILSNKLTEIIDDLAESNDIFVSRIAKIIQYLYKILLLRDGMVSICLLIFITYSIIYCLL